MSETNFWRQRFIELSDEMRRERNEDAFTVMDDPQAPLVMTLAVNGSVFDAIHFATGDESDSRILIQCHFGVVPEDQSATILKRALIANQGSARAHAAMFALNAESNELVYSVFQSLENISASQLLEAMGQMADFAQHWRAGYSVATH